MSANDQLPWVDVAKAVAAQLILWHHLAFYGPMADVAWPLAPPLFEALARHARLAVQVFLVVGGFLAARKLLAAWAPQATAKQGAANIASPPRWQALAAAAWQRYLRLVVPYAVALGLALLANTVARSLMQHPSVMAPASTLERMQQAAAQLLLLQDVLGLPAWSAGVWYVAIDFQLHVVMLLLAFAAQHWVARQGHTLQAAGTVWAGGVALAVVASLFWFNRQAGGDVWAPYFFASYGMGALAAAWARAHRPRWALVVAFVVVGLALAVDLRSRIALAAMVALALALGADRAWATLPSGAARVSAYLSRQSYALFLVHFPVCLVVNAVFTRFAAPTPSVQAWGLVAAWVASMVVAHALHRGVELPLARRMARRSVVAV
jgi:peptidoglycan/LPS O-acetylase OafA/YrhL